ncbi:MAG: glycosyltransferase family 4 protein [Verrucomicrobia bacterium]|nr:glycosyltransferase family 4 protein [Verrucomicrobiota bacterium]
MRIAVCAWESLHSIAVGGLAVHVSELAAALERAGNEVHVFTPRGPLQRAYERVEGVHYHRVAFSYHQDLVEEILNLNRAIIHDLWQTEDNLRAPFDVVHCHDWLTAPAGEWAKVGRGRRFVLTMHSTDYGRNGNNFYGGRCRQIRDLEWRGCYEGARVIAVSCALRDELAWLYQVPLDKMSVVYNGVSYHYFNGPFDSGAIKSQIGIALWEPMVLFSGRMTQQSGPDILMESLPALRGANPRAKFVFMGDGDMRWPLQQRARDLGVDAACRFVGHRTGGGLVQMFQAADIVAVPSRNEPFGIVILEAWSAGKPVIATDRGGPNEFVWHGVTGLKAPPAVPELTAAFAELTKDWDRARWMGCNGRVAVERMFSWDRVAAETLAVYRG